MELRMSRYVFLNQSAKEVKKLVRGYKGVGIQGNGHNTITMKGEER